MQKRDEIIIAVLDLTKPEIARVRTVKRPDDRVEVCEDLDIVFEMIELRAFVGIAFCDSCTKRMLVFAVHAYGTVQFESTVIWIDLVDIFVVSDELV